MPSGEHILTFEDDADVADVVVRGPESVGCVGRDGRGGKAGLAEGGLLPTELRSEPQVTTLEEKVGAASRRVQEVRGAG